MIVTQTSLIPSPMEKVVEVLCSEAFNVEVERGREGVVNTRFEETHRDEREVRFVLHSEEYVRKKTGRLDRSKRTPSSMTSLYRPQEGVLTWEYNDASTDSRFLLRGTYRLTARGVNTRLVHEVQIEVRIPLIGKQIAKFIARQFEKDYPRYQAAMRRYLSV